ncbi:MAG: CrcB family protein [Bacteroidia bacterium]|nr:CrcB family protein [Bacteroidia bacterium]MDW8015475.1 CrcB family protein [Bacteroidia bacterium]
MRGGLLVAIGVGAIGGALLRFWAQRQFNLSTLSPLGTFLVNMVGAFVLGILTALFDKESEEYIFYGLSTGFCGSLTTFSSITLEVFEMLRLEKFWQAALYLSLTIVLGVMILGGGYWIGNHLRG